MASRVLGLDVGNDYTKTSTGVRFRSTKKTGSGQFLPEDCYNVVWNGKSNIVGIDDGETYTEPDKFDKEVYKLCLLTAVALSYPEEHIKVKLVIGTPVLYYDNLGSKATQAAKEMKKQTITVNGVTKTIEIEDCLTFPQSYIIFSNPDKYKNAKTLVIDIGGGTVDVSLWEFKQKLSLKEKDSYLEGYTEHIVNAVRDFINSDPQFMLNLTDDEVLDVIDTGSVEVFGTPFDVSDRIAPILANYANLLISKITAKFVPRSCKNIVLVGGGAKSLKDYFKKAFPNLSVDEEPQLSNAKAFEAIGKMKFKDSDIQQEVAATV